MGLTPGWPGSWPGGEGTAAGAQAPSAHRARINVVSGALQRRAGWISGPSSPGRMRARPRLARDSPDGTRAARQVMDRRTRRGRLRRATVAGRGRAPRAVCGSPPLAVSTRLALASSSAGVYARLAGRPFSVKRVGAAGGAALSTCSGHRTAATAAAAAALLEAIRAVHGLVAAGLERDLSFLAAARARRAEHLALAARRPSRSRRHRRRRHTTSRSCRTRIRHRAGPCARRGNRRNASARRSRGWHRSPARRW